MPIVTLIPRTFSGTYPRSISLISPWNDTHFATCTYAAERATGQGEGDRDEDEGDRDGEEGTGVVLREEDGRDEGAEEAASTIDNFTCGSSIPLC